MGGGRGSSIDRNNQKENYSTLTVIIIIVTYEIRSCFKKFMSGPAQVHVCTKQINKLKDMQQQKKPNKYRYIFCQWHILMQKEEKQKRMYLGETKRMAEDLPGEVKLKLVTSPENTGLGRP